MLLNDARIRSGLSEEIDIYTHDTGTVCVERKCNYTSQGLGFAYFGMNLTAAIARDLNNHLIAAANMIEMHQAAVVEAPRSAEPEIIGPSDNIETVLF